MASDALRVGLVGCGLAARELHLPCLRALPGVEAVALCDTDEARMAEVGDAFGIASRYRDAKALFAEAGLDAVLVLTPPESHAALALAALDAGLHVLVEKPFSYDLAEADRVVERARETGRTLSVIHNELFNPSIDALRGLLARGEIGSLCSVQYTAALRHQLFVPDPWYYRTAGGRMGETLPHALCLLVEVIPDLEVLHVDARKLGHQIGPAGFEDVDFGIDELRVDFASRDGQQTAHVWYSFNTEIPTSLVLAGTQGHRIVYPFGRITELTATPTQVRQEMPGLLAHAGRRALHRLRLSRPGPEPVEATSHYRELADFFAAARAGREAAVTPHAAREVVRLWQTIVSHYDERIAPPRV